MSVSEAEQLLAERGFSGVRVDITGHAGELAALTVPESLWDRMAGPDGAAVAEQIRALGFRYVALDLAAS